MATACYRVTTTFACAAVEVDEEYKIQIKGTAPIFKQWVGQHLASLVNFYLSSGKLVLCIRYD